MTQDADTYCGVMSRLVRCYQRLRCLSLSPVVGSSPWPLLETVFGRCELRRCTLTIRARQPHADGQRKVGGLVPSLRPLAQPQPLGIPPHLHTLALCLQLEEAELQRVLRSVPALHHLRVRGVHHKDGVQCTGLIAEQPVTPLCVRCSCSPSS